MSEWTRVKWTEAGQVAALLAAPDLPGDQAALPPRLHFDRLVEGGALDEAVAFLGGALPRFESVAWAVGALDTGQVSPRAPHDAAALEACRAWLGEATDTRRRAAGRAADAASDDAPERLAALATFVSGGSIAPEDLAPVQPDAGLCGRLAAACVLTAAYRAAEPEAALRAALDQGARLARGEAGPVR